MGSRPNDTYPTAMHVAVAMVRARHVLAARPAHLHAALASEVRGPSPTSSRSAAPTRWTATPADARQEFGGYGPSGRQGHPADRGGRCRNLSSSPRAGHGVCTGLNSPKGWGETVARGTSPRSTGPALRRPPANKFEALAAHDALVQFSGSLKSAAAGIYKLAHDIGC
jgi:fumarate hydratase class II